MKVEIASTTALDDVLTVRGTVDGKQVTAQGWVSAMTNHYDPHAYGEDGHLLHEYEKDDYKKTPRVARIKVSSREMTADEKRAYCERLLVAAAPHLKAAPQRVQLFEEK